MKDGYSPAPNLTPIPDAPFTLDFIRRRPFARPGKLDLLRVGGESAFLNPKRLLVA